MGINGQVVVLFGYRQEKRTHRLHRDYMAFEVFLAKPDLWLQLPALFLVSTIVTRKRGSTA